MLVGDGAAFGHEGGHAGMSCHARDESNYCSHRFEEEKPTVVCAISKKKKPCKLGCWASRGRWVTAIRHVLVTTVGWPVVGLTCRGPAWA